ncbi:MAG: bifunctional glutamate N-acetyltransferase/amino-acid acetyltransferase ArgJ [Myxococcota bacterium]
MPPEGPGRRKPGRPARSFEVPGFRAAGIRCGIKPRGLDLALIVSDVEAAWAAVYTQSSVVGAPVEWSRRCTLAGRGVAAVINSGISNVARGRQGQRDTREMAELASTALGCRPAQVCVASTGVIGEPLPMARLRRGIPKLAAALTARGFADAAEAIRTTDTYAKQASAKARVGGREVRILGMAKGSGMIQPRMATMLAFVVTDAAVAPAHLRRLWKRVCDETFNRVTVDGETSTSDTALVMANGRAGNPRITSARSPGARAFERALLAVATQLARDLARDGEGATKLVDVAVLGARTRAEAEIAARSVANSMLVKTAIHGADPNWGRVLQAVGASRVTLRLARAEIWVGPACVFAKGQATDGASRRRAERHLKGREVQLRVGLGAGRAAARIWTCDLSAQYVRINADYAS